MTDRPVFDEHVREALEHLYEYTYLQAHPLAALLRVGPPHEKTGATLHRVLFEAIEELKPPRGAPYPSPAWRRYNYLFFRYVEANTPARVAQKLTLSERQSRRTREEALRALTDVLWASYLERGRPPEHPAEEAADLVDWPVGTGESPLAAEVKQIGATNSPEPVDLGAILAGVLDTLSPIASRRAVTIHLDLQPELPRVDADRGILRQALVEVLLYGLSRYQKVFDGFGDTPNPA
ncbi:MAG: hypothetical protein HYY04_01900, partial [Chloroflexi bacterium]|nr:hypothetical protein [Chloroflexota bacterium]